MKEDIDKLAAFTAARLMQYGLKEKDAIKKSMGLTGHLPDAEMFHQSTKNFGIGRDFHKHQLHWVHQGAFTGRGKPIVVKEEKILDPAIDDEGVSYYTLDETITRLLCKTVTAREILEGNYNVRSPQRC